MKKNLVKIGGFFLLCNIGLFFAIQQYITTRKNYVIFQNDAPLSNGGYGGVKSPSKGGYVTQAVDDVTRHYGHPSNITQHGSDINSSQQIKGSISSAVEKFIMTEKVALADKKDTIATSKSFDLAAVILVRIYKGDKPKWTAVELEQWVRYMQYAGVCRVYLYDNYKFKNESLQNWTAQTFSEFEVKYHDWSRYMPYSISGTQHTAYQHALDKYRQLSTWQIAFDMDEYPFSTVDREAGFLTRFLSRYSQKYPEVSEFSMRNFLFLGKPSNATILLDRILRRTPKPANALDKPMYKTDCVSRVQVHHNALRCGKSRDVDPVDLRNNHYWGARLQKWGDDTPEILAKTIPDNSAMEISAVMKERYLSKTSFLSEHCQGLM